MTILTKTTEDTKILTNAYSGAKGLASSVTMDNPLELEVQNFFIFKKDDDVKVLTVQTSDGQYFGTNSKTVIEAFEFISQVGLELPFTGKVIKNRSGQGGREYLNFILND